MKQTHLIRGLIILAIAAFFGYRTVMFSSPMNCMGLLLFSTLGILSGLNYLPSRWQNHTLNLGVTLFFLDLAFATIDLPKMGQALAQANYLMLFPVSILIFIHLYFRAVRWQWLLKPMGEVAFWAAFRAMCIGLAGNIILPARAGEFIRAYILGRSVGLAKTGVFATLVIERILDGLTVICFMVIAIIFGVDNALIRYIGMTGLVIYLAFLAALIGFMVKRHWADKIIHLLLPKRFADRLFQLLDGFSSGLNVLKNPSQLAMACLFSLLTWIFIPLSFWVSLLAFDFGTPIPWQTPMLMVPVVALGMTIPSAPGGIGWFQYAVKLTIEVTMLQATFMPNFNETVGAASIVVHVAQLIPQLIAGLLCFWAEGLSTKELNPDQP